ncbi:MAG: hypothetical protein ACE5KX_05925, partial [Acidimicrobiia bacterium]
FGEDLAPEAVQMWDGLHELTHFPDMGAFWQWAKGLGKGSVFRHLDPYDGAVRALRQLDGQGHDIVILTSKPDWAMADTFAWIAEHAVPTREVHLTEDKWRVACDVYLDDAPYQIERIHLARPEAATVRFVRPWNHPVAGVHDVRHWDQFVGLVTDLAMAGG